MGTSASPVLEHLERRQPAKEDPRFTALAKDALEAFDQVNDGVRAGFRPTHAKGILLTGTFNPSNEAGGLTSAPHVHRTSTPVTVRFSNFGGVPTVADDDPAATPRGFAIRFHLAEHSHTDIIAHSIDGFPVKTAEEFIEFLRAAAASKESSASPLPIESFLASHPKALRFVQTPQPIPLSFATEDYFAVNAYRFMNSAGQICFGRYRIRPQAGAACLADRNATRKQPNYLFDELHQRITKAPARFDIVVQIAAEGDVTDDSTERWPDDRPEIPFGTVELTAVAPDNPQAQQHIIFDPVPRVDGIEPSDDPLIRARAEVYLLSGRRRRIKAVI